MSVVVPVRNAEDFINDCLWSILRSRPRQVLVVDGRSTDRTLEAVRLIASQYASSSVDAATTTLEVIDDGGSGVAQARMLGIERAECDTVALIDADVVLRDDSLGALLEEFRGGSHVGLQATLLPESLSDDYWSRSLAEHQRIGRSRWWFSLCATLVDRDFMLANGLDVRIRSGEDIEFRYRMARFGSSLAVSRNVAVRHRFRGGFAEARHQWTEDGAGLAHLVRRNGMRAVFAFGIPAVGVVRGALFTLSRPSMLGYWICYLVFNYAAITTTLLSRQALTAPRRSSSDDVGSTMGLVWNSSALAAARVAPMTLGFVAWAVAARGFDARDVGLAAAALSAAVLISHLAASGQGNALILLLPRQGDDGWRMVRDGALLAGGAGFLVAVILAALAGLLGQDLDLLVASPLTLGLCVVLGVTTSLAFYYDFVAMARRRSHRALLRSVLQSSLFVAAVSVGAFASDGEDGLLWTLSGATIGASVSAMAGNWEERKRRPTHKSALVAGSTMRALTSNGLPNLLLTAASRAPMFALPFIITELVSPASNAAWYTAWMMSMVVWFVPNSAAASLQARLVLPAADRSPERQEILHALKTSAGLGFIAVFGVCSLGPVLLAQLGPVYQTATHALWILSAVLLPVMFSETWLALCRVRHQWVLAATICALAGLASLGASVVVAPAGLTAVAAAWLGGQTLVGLVAVAILAVNLRTSPQSAMTGAVTGSLPEGQAVGA